MIERKRASLLAMQITAFYVPSGIVIRANGLFWTVPFFPNFKNLDFWVKQKIKKWEKKGSEG